MIDTNRKKIRNEWYNLIKGKSQYPDIIDPDVYQSWKRSIKKHIDPERKGPREFMDSFQLDQLKIDNEELMKTSEAMMNSLYDLVKGSGFLVMLCDARGYILRSIGDSTIMTDADNINFIEGANWGEHSVGTNAICLAINLQKPVQVFAEEHFCMFLKSWTCSSSPIFINGRLQGILNMSAHYSKVQSHTLGMVVAAANAITSILKEKKISKELSITNDILEMMMENMDEGIIATDNEDKILRVNSKICKLFNKPQHDLINRPVYEIIPNDKIQRLKEVHSTGIIKEMNISIGNKYQQIVIRNRKIKEGSVDKGMLYTINESKKIKMLVNRVSGSNAGITFDQIIGENKAFIKLVSIAKRVSKSNSNILLTGESGTGKEMFAQAIHNESHKKSGPFIAINCGAIPRELIESELFGFVEGAFTGSRKHGNPGKFELAEGGTIFLDEIGDMPFDMQVALLRVLENKEISRIGSSKSIKVDVRVIAATNRNLKKAVEEGKFRRDLYYRLNVLNLNMIPLRERINDIELLSHFFINKYNLLLNKNVEHISIEALEGLKKYKWPGNVRELENTIERALNISVDNTITRDELNQEITNDIYSNVKTETLSLNNMEKSVIIKALDENNFNVTQTAKQLGIAKTTLYRKMKQYNIQRSVS